MRPSALLSLLLLLAVLSSVASAQCRNRCTTRYRAKRDCRGRRQRRLCELQTCRSSCRRGRRCRKRYICTRKNLRPWPKPPVPNPIPPPTTPTCATGCSRRYRNYSCLPPCKRVPCGRRGRYYQCLPLFIPTPPPVPPQPPLPPPESPTPYPSPPPFPAGVPVPADTFTELTTLTGTATKAPTVQRLPDGGTYRVSFTVTLNPKGVIRLDRVKDKVNVVCLPNGQVRVRTSPEQAAKLTLEKMFPIGSTLVISKSAFANCALDRRPTNPGENEAERALREFQNDGISSQDQFLIVTGVSGTTADATVSGTVANCLALYSNANIRVEPVSPSGTNTIAVRKNTPSTPGGLTATGSASNGVKLKSLSLSVTNGRVAGRIVFDSRPKLDINTNSGLPTTSGKSTITLIDEVDSLPLLQTRPDLPPLSLGSQIRVTAEVDSSVVGSLAGTGIQGAPTATTSNDLEPTSEEVTISLSGPVSSPTVSESRRSLAPENNKVSITPSITQGQVPTASRELAERFAMNVVSRQAINFGGTARFTFFFYGASFFDGVFRAWCYSFTITVQHLTNISPAFPPQIGQFGTCNVCHFLQFRATISGFCYNFRANFRGFPVAIVSQSLSFTFISWTGCYAPAPPSINCNGECCNTAIGQSCNAGGTCASPSPSPSVTPSSVARQLIQLCEGGDCEKSVLDNRKDWFMA